MYFKLPLTNAAQNSTHGPSTLPSVSVEEVPILKWPRPAALGVFASEGAAVSWIKSRVAKGRS
jgi:hypothetical protein